MTAQGPAALIDLASEPKFALGGLEVRPPTRELVAGAQAELLEPRVMQVLVALARRRGAVVSRDDLIASCWDGRAVGDDAINRCIQAIRRLAQAHGGFAITTVSRVGYRLDESALPFAKPPGPAGSAIGSPSADARTELRRLTVLACNLHRRAPTSLGAEDWYEIAAEYRRAVAGAVERYGGYVTRGLGEDLRIYFGYPEAKEDAAERAVRAALNIVEALAPLRTRIAASHGIELAARIGVHAGTVVIAGAGPSVEMFGEAPELAGRIEAMAGPGAVLVSAEVRELVAGLFETEGRASFTDGGGAPVELFEVLAPGPGGRRGRGRPGYGRIPFVGRDDEIHLLLSRWRRVRQGEGQLALVTGEPGIGKTRLVEEFRRRIDGEPHVWIACAGAPLYANTPFHAVTQMLNQALGWRGGESEQERVDGLERALGQTRLGPAEAFPLIAELMGLAVPERFPPLSLSPEQRRQRLLACLAEWVISAAGSQPLAIAMEDLQWVDPSTLELLGTLAEQGAAAPLMLLCTARPEFQAPWPMRSHHAPIMLGRLSDHETRQLVVGVIADAALDEGVIEAVIKRTDGVPLFAEELTRLMLEGKGQAGERDIPVTLQDSLGARLDRLGRAKDVAQLGAVLGREFSYELLAAVASIPHDELQADLAKLADAELIHVRGIAPQAAFRFKHALILQAAYEALLKGRRRELHARVAQTMTTRFAAVAEAHPEVLARHWSDADEPDKAVAAWSAAAKAAGGRFAYEEAIQSYRQALSALATLPETRERDARELELNISLGEYIGVTRGFHSVEYVTLNERGADLAERHGDLLQLVMQMMARFVTAFTAGELPRARALADQLLDLSVREASDFSLRVGCMAQLLARVSAGDLVGAEANFIRWEEVVERSGYSPFSGETLTVLGGMAEAAFGLGRPDWACELAARLVAHAREKGPFEIVAALSVEAWIRVLRREPGAAEAPAAQALALAEAHGFNQAGQARASLAWARAHLGLADEGLALAEKSLVGWVGGGVPRLSEARRMLAQVRALNGQAAEAAAEFDDLCEAPNDNPVMLSGHLIGRAEVRIRLGCLSDAETDLRAAIALAQDRAAMGWRLRAATLLAGLLRQRGDCAAARDVLLPVCQWFSEGRDTVDLKEATAMLAALD